jgi:prefoldin subunit 4
MTSEAEAAEVRKVDQEQINEFGRLNKKLQEIRAEIKQKGLDAEKFDDASTELMMLEGGNVMLLVGESFIEVNEEYATQYCEKKHEVR